MKRYTLIHVHAYPLQIRYPLNEVYDYNGLLYLIFFFVVVIYVHHIICTQQKFQIYQCARPLNKQDKGFQALHDT